MPSESWIGPDQLPERKETVPMDYRTRYQESAVAMSRMMQAATDSLRDNSQLDLSPDALLNVISEVQSILNEARYYATRMQVYQNLIDAEEGKRKVRKP
jgi:hypothetical protein